MNGNVRSVAGDPHSRGESLLLRESVDGMAAREPGSGDREGLVQRFLERVSAASRRVLLLDYDGTLAPFRSERMRVTPYGEIVEPLRRLASSDRGRIAIVSGRPLSDLQALLGWLDPMPELWGSHGLERSTREGVSSSRPDAAVDRSVAETARAWARERGWEDFFEPKPFGFALHGRSVAPEEFARMRRELVVRWSGAAREAGLEAKEFDGGIEFRPSGRHKGEVVETTLREAGPGAAVAYLGDDATDEDAFRALDGRGLAVLVRPPGAPDRPTLADVRLQAPEELARFLRDWERALEASGPGPAAKTETVP